MRAGEQRGRNGFTFVAVLLLLALVSLGLAAVGPLWSQQARRDREQELLRIGALYAQAIARYRDVSPGSVKQYPASLDDLLLDRRFVGTMRHLRKAYADPLDPRRPWGLVRNDAGGVIGVYSQSEGEPLTRAPMERDGVRLSPARRYSELLFLASDKGAVK